jgi:hypothetical protein
MDEGGGVRCVPAVIFMLAVAAVRTNKQTNKQTYKARGERVLGERKSDVTCANQIAKV